MAKGPPEAPRIVNRKVRYDFEVLETLEAGISLTGSEVKSLRAGRASLDESYAYLRGGELFLLDCNIAPYPMAGYAQHKPTRERKLLLHRRQIKRWQSRVTQRGLTIVPLAIYFNERDRISLFGRIGRRSPRAVRLALLQGSDQFDLDTLDRVTTQERAHLLRLSPAWRRGTVSGQGFGRSPRSGLVCLNVDVMRLDRHSLQQVGGASCQRPVDLVQRQAGDEYAQRRQMSG